jgi:hypothetical protein
MYNDDIKGEVVKFARKMHFGDYKILIGKVKDIIKDSNIAVIRMCVDYFQSIFANINIPLVDIIQIEDINKTGHPLELIDDFKINKYENELIDFFLNGQCYLFASYLKKRILNSDIIYLQEEHHYALDYCQHLYDITGDVTNQYKECTKVIHRYEGDWKKDR